MSSQEDYYEKLKTQAEFFTRVAEYVRENILEFSDERAQHIAKCLDACFEVTAMVAVSLRERPEEGSSYWATKLGEIRDKIDLLSIFQGKVRAMQNFVRQQKRMQDRALQFKRSACMLEDPDAVALSNMFLKEAYTALKFRDEVSEGENLKSLSEALQGLNTLADDKIKLLIRATYDLREPARRPGSNHFPDPTQGNSVEGGVKDRWKARKKAEEDSAIEAVSLEASDVTI